MSFLISLYSNSTGDSLCNAIAFVIYASLSLNIKCCWAPANQFYGNNHHHNMLLHMSCLLLLSSLSISAGQDWAETGYNNSCLYQNEGLNRDGPQDFDCPKFIIESTDQIWNMYRGRIIGWNICSAIQITENLKLTLLNSTKLEWIWK